ncbi:phosphomethylpyrimidine synthase ThiC, partial [Desulfotomaculum copahuensis]
RYRAESRPENEDSCTMCGKMCAVRNMNKFLNGHG